MFAPSLVRSPGTVQTPASRSTSSQVASRTSRDRHAVRTRNSKASFVELSALHLRTFPSASVTSPCIIARCVSSCADLRQRRTDGVTRGVVLPVAFRNRPLHDGSDSLPDLPCRLSLRVPDWQQAPHHIRRLDGVHRHASDLRIGVGLERRLPRRHRLCVPPVGAVHLDHGSRRFPERRDEPLGSHLAGTAASERQLAVVVGRLARLAERDQRIGAEPQVATATADRQPLHPGLRPGLLHQQDQTGETL